jgi:hypothetical protein
LHKRLPASAVQDDCTAAIAASDKHTMQHVYADPGSSLAEGTMVLPSEVRRPPTMQFCCAELIRCDAPNPRFPSAHRRAGHAVARFHAEHHQPRPASTHIGRRYVRLAHPGFIGTSSVAVAGWIALNLLCMWLGYMCVRATPDKMLLSQKFDGAARHPEL